MSRSTPKRSKQALKSETGGIGSFKALPSGYFRIRDFEYVQPLYDLAFLLEIDALAKGAEVPKYRTFSLWRAGYSLDGYGTTVDRWLDGSATDADLDYIPSTRIKQYLNAVRKTGTIAELRPFRNERFERCLRLRSVRGLGPSQIALLASADSLEDETFSHAAMNLNLHRDRITELYHSSNLGPWQTAHVVPPLLRFLSTVEKAAGQPLLWDLSGITNPFESITTEVTVSANVAWDMLSSRISVALKREGHFRRDSHENCEAVKVKHRLGWSFYVRTAEQAKATKSIFDLVQSLDPIGASFPRELVSDLHLHTAWSDGSASVSSMAAAVASSGLKYFAVTDHSRSSKLQGGLTPLLWLRQANALTLAGSVCPILHGIEVDILKDGRLDLPHSLLAAVDFVVASVHSSWTDDARENTNRLLRAIESGCIDVIAHPTSTIVGKPGVPDYWRPPAEVHWNAIFETCARWGVALEMNCFPSRLDLPLSLLAKAIDAGCAISFGSDAHARSHLVNLRFGEAALRQLTPRVVLNRFSYKELQHWIRESREKRLGLTRSTPFLVQAELPLDPAINRHQFLDARILPPRNIPAGCKVVGIDLTAGDKATGVAVLNEFTVDTCSLISDEEILAYLKYHKPKIVSIDSPLGLPGGGSTINPKAGIVRAAEYDLASVGVPAYPALIDSMKKLTLRGIRLRQTIEQFPGGPRVIESYPGAAQDILCIPRKQKSLDLLREGLRRLGLRGTGLETKSHDEMDAITSAIVGRYFESGLFEPMGTPKEAQLIVPKISPLAFDEAPILCLAGKTGAGKSVVARYLSVFYGFEWVRTRNMIRDLLVEDMALPQSKRIFRQQIGPGGIKEDHLRAFGALILDEFKQVPLRTKLTNILCKCNNPIVVDSIRDTLDVDRTTLGRRPVIIWFVDCNETILRQRLAEKTKSGEKRLNTPSPVDRTAPAIHREADDIIPNSGSLEELRWRVDDTLFQHVRLNNE